MRVLTRSKKKLFVAAVAPAAMLVLALPGMANAAPPLATTSAATEVAKETATLNGLVNPKGLPTTFFFEYGTTKKYGSKTSEANAGFGNTTLEVFQSISGLTRSTLYHFRIVAKNFSGTTFGADETFTTLPVMAVTEPATDLFSKEATLNGKVNTQGEPGFYYFEYGTSEEYGSKTPEVEVSNWELKDVSAKIEGLTPGATYHFRVVEVSGETTKVGADKTFAAPEHTWYPQTTPNLTSNDRYEGVSCLSGTECMAVGDGPIAAKWNGTEWSSTSIPGSGELNNVSCSSFTACTAVGIEWVGANYAPLVERWNGTEWKTQKAPAPEGAKSTTLDGVSCTSSTNCIAVGDYWTGGEGNWWPIAMVWNGSEWKLQEMAKPAKKIVNYMEDLSCSSSTACTAVGESSMDFFAERWNGTEWKVQTLPLLGGSLEGVSCPSATYCIAVGEADYYEASGGDPYTASWNGSEWQTISTPMPGGAEGGVLQGVSCSSASACSAVGSWNAGSSNHLLAESWGGSSWQIQPAAAPSGAEADEFRDDACWSAFACEAVGAYAEGGWSRTLASRFE